jgi:hypothetical protein
MVFVVFAHVENSENVCCDENWYCDDETQHTVQQVTVSANLKNSRKHFGRWEAHTREKQGALEFKPDMGTLFGQGKGILWHRCTSEDRSLTRPV